MLFYGIIYGIIYGDNHEETVRILVDAGADVNAISAEPFSNPMLYWAIFEDNPELVRALVDADANVYATDNRGNSMLYWAIVEENPDIVRILTAAGAKQ